MKVILKNKVEIDNVTNMSVSYSRNKTFLNMRVNGDVSINSLVKDDDAFNKITVIREGLSDEVIEGYGDPSINKNFEEGGNSWSISLTKDA